MRTMEALVTARRILLAMRQAEANAEALGRVVERPVPLVPVTPELIEKMEACRQTARERMKTVLSSRSCVVLECFYLEGATISSISKGLGICPRTVKKIKADAIRKLKEDEARWNK